KMDGVLEGSAEVVADPMLTKTTAAMPLDVPTIADYERQAAAMLRKDLFQAMFSEGARTLRNNLVAFDRPKFRARVLVDLTGLDPSTVVLGQPIRLPVLLAPVGLHMRVHGDGELATARAAGDAGTIMTLSHV